MKGKIVVGVDGSEPSRAALRWALQEAELREAELVIVNAWSSPTVPAYAGVAAAPLSPGMRDDAREGAADLVRTVADEVAGEERALHFDYVTEEGSAAEVLIEAARDADVLVVGSRGHGGFTGLLLGSVSQQVAHHAPCPVVIVRSPAVEGH
jgi:nucleotide-binding universal stress UspA family protein